MPVNSNQQSPQNVHPHWRRTLYILVAAQLFTAIGFSSIFPFLPLYVKALGSSSGVDIEILAGLVYSGQALTMMIASPFWGILADRFGRKLMVERAMFGGAAILLLMAFARTAEELVLLRAIQGLITGTVAAANAMIVSITPRYKLGYALGLLQVGLGLGVALGPLLGGVLADAFGYGPVFYATAALLFSAGILVWYGADERFTPPDTRESPFSGLTQKWRLVLDTPGVPRIYALRFLTQLGRSTILPIAPIFISTLLINQQYLNTYTGVVVSVAAITTTLSAGYLGRLGDRIGHQRIILISALFGGFFYLLQSQVVSAWQLISLQALVGIALGGVVPSVSALLGRLTEADDAGTVYGLDHSIDSAGRALAPMIGSAISVQFGLRSVFAITAVIFLSMGLLTVKKIPK